MQGCQESGALEQTIVGVRAWHPHNRMTKLTSEPRADRFAARERVPPTESVCLLLFVRKATNCPGDSSRQVQDPGASGLPRMPPQGGRHLNKNRKALDVVRQDLKKNNTSMS